MGYVSLFRPEDHVSVDLPAPFDSDDPAPSIQCPELDESATPSAPDGRLGVLGHHAEAHLGAVQGGGFFDHPLSDIVDVPRASFAQHLVEEMVELVQGRDVGAHVAHHEGTVEVLRLPPSAGRSLFGHLGLVVLLGGARCAPDEGTDDRDDQGKSDTLEVHG